MLITSDKFEEEGKEGDTPKNKAQPQVY